MLSICIPIYNFDVNSLVESLQKQMSKLHVPCELILIDDCSENHFREVNRNICQKSTYIELTENIGRSRIRNLFLKYAQNEYLLFLDCDAKLASDNYLSDYLSFITKNNPAVIFGGSIYETQKPSRAYFLAWKYGHLRQTKAATERSKNPYHSFMTNNFCVRKDIFEKVQFNEKITEYGHEDTLFGLDLKSKKIQISHFQNPVYHIGIDTNEVYLKKVETSIKSLSFIQQNISEKEQLEQNVNILRAYSKLNKMGLLAIIKFFYFLFKQPIRWTFKKGFINLRLFDFYKLGYYISLRNK